MSDNLQIVGIKIEFFPPGSAYASSKIIRDGTSAVDLQLVSGCDIRDPINPASHRILEIDRTYKTLNRAS